MKTPWRNTVPDTTPVTAAMARMVTWGTSEHQLVARCGARQFPDLTRAAFVAALQVATAAAERHVVAEALKYPRTEAWPRSASVSVSPVKHLG